MKACVKDAALFGTPAYQLQATTMHPCASSMASDPQEQKKSRADSSPVPFQEAQLPAAPCLPVVLHPQPPPVVVMVQQIQSGHGSCAIMCNHVQSSKAFMGRKSTLSHLNLSRQLEAAAGEPAPFMPSPASPLPDNCASSSHSQEPGSCLKGDAVDEADDALDGDDGDARMPFVGEATGVLNELEQGLLYSPKTPCMLLALWGASRLWGQLRAYRSCQACSLPARRRQPRDACTTEQHTATESRMG